MKSMKIAVDFDGTSVTHEFPLVGKNIGAEHVMRELVANGHQLILFTMRSDEHSIGDEFAKEIGVDPSPAKNYLSDALDWFRKEGIPLYGVQSDPDQTKWTTSPKAYAHLYIDDAALGCPLKSDPSLSHKAFVDWKAVRALLVEQGFLKND